MMKKVVAIILVIAMVINAFLGLTNAMNNVTMKVVEVNNEVVTVEDENGDLWQFCGNGFEVNETINCIMIDEKIIDCA